MSSDPFADIREASTELAERLARTIQDTETGWADDSRVAFDARYSSKATAAAKRTSDDLRRLGDQVRAAMAALG